MRIPHDKETSLFSVTLLTLIKALEHPHVVGFSLVPVATYPTMTMQRPSKPSELPNNHSPP
jgi:hypothetical protein